MTECRMSTACHFRYATSSLYNWCACEALGILNNRCTWKVALNHTDCRLTPGSDKDLSTYALLLLVTGSYKTLLKFFALWRLV